MRTRKQKIWKSDLTKMFALIGASISVATVMPIIIGLLR